jgi:hypothetical protein
MATKQGDLALLNHPLAQELLQSTIPARLSYTWSDGTPRVAPIWFHWNGEQIIISTPLTSPKAKVFPQHPNVALTIDTNDFPWKVLLIRGKTTTKIVDGLPAEYIASAKRYLGEEGGQGFIAQAKTMFPQMLLIAVQPEWVGLLDFEQRWPSAIEAAMAAG